MKKNHRFLGFAALVLSASLILCAILSANAAGTLSTADINAIVNTTTDAGMISSPFTAAVKAARESVVLVNNYTTTTSYGSNPYSFGYGFGFGYGNGRGAATERLAGTGSGTVISPYGHVLTNYHVIEDASRVTISDGEKEYEASIVNYDESKDIAVLLCPELNLPAAQLGDSDQLQEGEWAIVIGNPLGEDFFRSTTVGVVSSLEREVESEGTDKYGLRKTVSNSMIQVDAAINSGNSGGGMFNVLGQLMGIPSLKYTSSFLSSTSIDNIGMCIPINSAKELIRDALEQYNGEEVDAYLAEKAKEADRLDNNIDMTNRPRLGVTISTLDQNNAAVARGVLPSGAWVQTVEAGSPAENAGILPGDIIVEADGTVIGSNTALQNVLAQHQEGDVISVKVYRVENVLSAQYVSDIGEGEYIDLTVTLRTIEAPAA